MSDTNIELKGSGFTLSVLHLQNNDLTAAAQALESKISQAPQFFMMAPIVVNIEKLNGEAVDFQQLKQTFEHLNLVVVGISGATDEQKAAAKTAGLATLNAAKAQPVTTDNNGQVQTQVRYERVEVPVEVEVPTYKPAMVVKQNLRSGQQIYAKDTDLVVIGAVSNGAEVVADGNVHVYGALRGRAVAGAKGNNEARIFAHKVEAELISINGNYWTSEQLQKVCWKQSACIYLDGDKITVSSLEI
ncbi:septum formation inhibitor [Catenovulum agarivorans DS-2]|uniref:Probable septum site-determining protein MinC n=1 Tax=Catenovulum agarivorans DS-2 TaxID=1328313 RepID=W7QWM5_9ALTE|nr:septum site-determining protein MinC [Catenovulum agarivorans]EWH12138.1 septum formation inhibitor [Catenovulum agarivorans DS-2]